MLDAYRAFLAQVASRSNARSRERIDAERAVLRPRGPGSSGR